MLFAGCQWANCALHTIAELSFSFEVSNYPQNALVHQNFIWGCHVAPVPQRSRPLDCIQAAAQGCTWAFFCVLPLHHVPSRGIVPFRPVIPSRQIPSTFLWIVAWTDFLLLCVIIALFLWFWESTGFPTTSRPVVHLCLCMRMRRIRPLDAQLTSYVTIHTSYNTCHDYMERFDIFVPVT